MALRVRKATCGFRQFEQSQNVYCFFSGSCFQICCNNQFKCFPVFPLQLFSLASFLLFPILMFLSGCRLLMLCRNVFFFLLAFPLPVLLSPVRLLGGRRDTVEAAHSSLWYQPLRTGSTPEGKCTSLPINKKIVARQQEQGVCETAPAANRC